jgi:hypothetical protein
MLASNVLRLSNPFIPVCHTERKGNTEKISGLKGLREKEEENESMGIKCKLGRKELNNKNWKIHLNKTKIDLLRYLFFLINE